MPLEPVDQCASNPLLLDEDLRPDHLRGMRSEHRFDSDRLDEAPDIVRLRTTIPEVAKDLFDRTALRDGARSVVLATPADPMDPFRLVHEREVGRERFDQARPFGRGDRRDPFDETPFRRLVSLTPGNRIRPDRFDLVEEADTFLLLDHLAQDRTQDPDFVAERLILLLEWQCGVGHGRKHSVCVR